MSYKYGKISPQSILYMLCRSSFIQSNESFHDDWPHAYAVTDQKKKKNSVPSSSAAATATEPKRERRQKTSLAGQKQSCSFDVCIVAISEKRSSEVSAKVPKSFPGENKNQKAQYEEV
ncbi:hypothetical protein RUM43_004958 [Polyplax serrata]|uniref:Uncharacterized protein n=1 Tax=Polyplax serrata TaxID=468196 RepID=A0AAN8SBD9_POLSC